MTPTWFDVLGTLNLVANPINLTRALNGAKSANLEHSSQTARRTSASDQPCKESLMEHSSNMLFSREAIARTDPTDSGQSTVAHQHRAISAPS